MYNPRVYKIANKTAFNKLMRDLRHSGIKGRPNSVYIDAPEKYPAVVAVNHDEFYGHISHYGTWIYQF